MEQITTMGTTRRKQSALNIQDILPEAVERGASDILISAGCPVMFNVHGGLEPYSNGTVLTPVESRDLSYGLLDEDQRTRFELERDGDLSFEMFDECRFRVNVFQQRGSVACVLRLIPLSVPSYEEIGIPESLVKKLMNISSGLFLVTGPTGSGKSTTVASYLDYLNHNHPRPQHIITIEDPIEFRMRSRRCMINQREVGIDTQSFATGLRAALRQMANIIFVGEMRDRETIEIALTAAETGNLVVSTLHTQSAAKTINRIIDVFPVQDQEDIRTRLSLTLKGVISQQLMPLRRGSGRIAAREVLFVNHAVSNMIRDAKVHQINNVITGGQSEGMSLMDDALVDLYRQGLVKAEDLIPRLQDPQKAQEMTKR
ncbi:MAG TPA: PilT/PilU family type 4a pilus ATPase [Candidatus Krumholzibacteria bacterium]|nr:PilT/PilU family type 4a pilus ATPase [Candidatus Krumholzibacteria bacterium]HRX51919.1 PilT/PilU family type 4a pilus ATPase [Candidatus Krumholzibacteria bacterium]